MTGHAESHDNEVSVEGECFEGAASAVWWYAPPQEATGQLYGMARFAGAGIYHRYARLSIASSY